MAMLQENYSLYQGVQIPKLGFGTWQMENTEGTYRAVSFALKNGYRHVDSARAYGNEEMVGKAVRECGLAREEVFVTTKLPAEIKTHEGALKSFEESMEALNLSYIDLYLIHAPWPWEEMGKDCTPGNREVWKAFEEIYAGGRCRAIGVSNFSVADLKALSETCTVKPMVNQIRYFIGNTQSDVTAFCQKENILVEAYSPLATGRILNNREVGDLAQKYGVSLPQLCIRYALEKGTLPLPKSTHEAYILENAQVDFTISSEDIAYLDGLRDTAK